MYETLAMLKPSSSFSLDDLLQIVNAVARTGTGIVSRFGNEIHLSLGAACLDIGENGEATVVDESNEISQEFGIPCAGSRSRLEFSGSDPNMDLFNDYLIICERLEATGKFVIFDPQECKLMFD